jgi:anti-sigma regulatory factor (Ser/Thr protein kinase)
MATKRFSCSLNNLEGMCDYVSHYANKAGLSDSEAYAVQLAVDEATTNIIEHGYGEECPSRIDISCEILDGGLKITIYDDADPFDPTTVPEPDMNVSLEEIKPRGLGIFLMRKMMDEIKYEANPELGNTLTMIKKHKPEE